MNSKSIIKNSIWGITSNVIQNIVLSIYFVVIARYSEVCVFSSYIVANSLYQLFSGLAQFGLMHLIVRELNSNTNTPQVAKTFYLTEVILGIFFTILYLLFSYFSYKNSNEFIFCLILSINIFIDNIIYCYKSINISISKQLYNTKVTLVESILKLTTTSLLVLLKYDLYIIVFINVILRLISLSYFNHIMNNNFKFINIVKTNHIFNVSKLYKIIKNGSSFMLISSLSIIFWKINTLLLSKLSTNNEVAIFEIGLKVFGIIQIIPVIFLTSLYPKLSKEFILSKKIFSLLYSCSFILLLFYSALCVLLFEIFGNWFLNIIFGQKFIGTFSSTNLMMLTIAPMSLVLVQAYVLLSSRNEKLDMLLNIFNLLSTVVFSIFLIPKYGAIGASLSILISFTVFYFLQEFFLLKKKLLYNSHLLFFKSFMLILPIIFIKLYFTNHTLITISSTIYILFLILILRKTAIKLFKFLKNF